MVICFVHDWEPDYYQELTWKDGLSAALKELSKRGHTVHVITYGIPGVIRHPYFNIQVTDDIVGLVGVIKPDVILHWADFTRPHAKPLRELDIPMAICFAGGEVLGENVPYFDHIFVESQVYYDKLKNEGFDVSIAFGTNTELFAPIEQTKIFDTIFPGTFAAWKRHGLYAQATDGLASLAVGYMYDDHETECWEDCLKHNVTILPHVSAETLHYLLAASRICVIPSLSSGGSQRTVLEAMAMNIPLVITDSDKFDYAYGRSFQADPTPQSIRGYIDACLDGDCEANTRQYVLDNWSEFTYADALEEGLSNLL